MNEPQGTRPGDGDAVELSSGTGSIRRDGAWDVPPALLVKTLTGSVSLDFSEARIGSANVDIELEVGTGAVHLWMPATATVDCEGLRSGTGTVRSPMPSSPAVGAAPGPHFVVHGTIGTGSVKIRPPHRIGPVSF